MSGVIIPKPFVYDSSFATFYTQIDDEHKVLFQSVFDVAAKPGDQKAVDRMYAVMNSHFANEEGIMQYANYVDFHKHKMQHDRFLARLQTITAPVGKDCIHFAKDWLVNHIKVTDFKYRGKL